MSCLSGKGVSIRCIIINSADILMYWPQTSACSKVHKAEKPTDVVVEDVVANIWLKFWAHTNIYGRILMASKQTILTASNFFLNEVYMCPPACPLVVVVNKHRYDQRCTHMQRCFRFPVLLTDRIISDQSAEWQQFDHKAFLDAPPCQLWMQLRIVLYVCAQHVILTSHLLLFDFLWFLCLICTC